MFFSIWDYSEKWRRNLANETFFEEEEAMLGKLMGRCSRNPNHFLFDEILASKNSDFIKEEVHLKHKSTSLKAKECLFEHRGGKSSEPPVKPLVETRG